MRKILASLVLVAGAIVLFGPLVYGQVDVIPSQQTHGDTTFLFANHTLGGFIHETNGRMSGKV